MHLAGEQRTDGQAWRWTIPASLLLHTLVLLAIAAWPNPLSPAPPEVRSIEVQVFSEAQYRAATAPPPAVIEAPQPAAISNLPSTEPDPPGRPAAPQVAPMIAATQLFSVGILKDPSNREVRRTLPTLAPYERITQLCNIEALEQIRVLKPEPVPDSMVASAFSDTTLAADTLTATGAAYRSGHKWYAAEFSCTVAPGLEGVVAFQFRIGKAIPEGEWDSHGLNAADEDE